MLLSTPLCQRFLSTELELLELRSEPLDLIKTMKNYEGVGINSAIHMLYKHTETLIVSDLARA